MMLYFSKYHLYRAYLRNQLIPFKPQDKGYVKDQNGDPDQNSSHLKKRSHLDNVTGRV